MWAWNLLKNYWYGIIPAVLVLIGLWLSETMTSNICKLHYVQDRMTVGNTNLIHLTMKNNSDSAIDSLTIRPHKPNLVDHSYSMDSLPDPDKTVWRGELKRNDKLEGIYVYRGAVPIISTFIQDCVVAKYQGRDKDSGGRVWSIVSLDNGDPALSKRTASVLWFLMPVGGFGLLLAGISGLQSWRAGRNKEEENAGGGRAGEQEA